MNSRKTTKYSYGSRGRGNKRNLVRLTAAKVGQEHGRVLNEQRDSNGVYEDLMVYVKSQAITTRKRRGRPRKCVLQNTLSQPATGSHPEIIYVPSVKEGSARENLVPGQYKQGPNSYSKIVLQPSPQSRVVLPLNSGVPTLLGINSQHNSTLRARLLNPPKQIVLGSNPYSQNMLGTKHCSQDAFGTNSCSHTAIGIKSSSHNIFGSSIQPQTVFRALYNKTTLGPSLNPLSVLRSNQTLNNHCQPNKPILEATPVALTRPVAPHVVKTKSDWPEDLQEVLDMWEHYPERHVQHLDRWLKETPESFDLPVSFCSSNLPTVVVKMHQMIEKWDETEENKIQYICDWLIDKEDFEQKVSTEPPPKVVVEVQPNSQHCGSWSSMND